MWPCGRTAPIHDLHEAHARQIRELRRAVAANAGGPLTAQVRAGSTGETLQLLIAAGAHQAILPFDGRIGLVDFFFDRLGLLLQGDDLLLEA